MIKYNSAINGIGYVNGNNGEILNAHISYKGRSVIIDYEFCLHNYNSLRDNKNKFVPFEMYPYGDDVYVGHVEVDDMFHKANIGKLIEILDEAIAKEPAQIDYNADFK